VKANASAKAIFDLEAGVVIIPPMVEARDCTQEGEHIQLILRKAGKGNLNERSVTHPEKMC
jgi:hypothetical protein